MSASKHVAPSISPKRWAYLKALSLGPGKYIYVSADARMIVNPTNPNGPLIPWVAKPGVTFDIGRNKAKRAAL